MICPKCAARMLPDFSVHYQSSADYTLDQNDRESVCSAWHCLCGQYIDRVVLTNRARQSDERRLLAQAETIAAWESLQEVVS